MTAVNDWTRDMMTKGFPELKKLYTMVGARLESVRVVLSRSSRHAVRSSSVKPDAPKHTSSIDIAHGLPLPGEFANCHGSARSPQLDGLDTWKVTTVTY